MQKILASADKYAEVAAIMVPRDLSSWTHLRVTSGERAFGGLSD